MSKYLYILDSGHGGIDPSTGKYVTAGKRMVKDGITFYEGVNNRDNVKRIMAGMKKEGLECIDIVNDWRDISLTERVIRANKLAKDRKCVYISIHSDANGNGKDWNSASGIGTYVYDKGSKSSNDLAKYMHQELVCNFSDLAKDRKIKKCAFYVVRATSMPAILLELGFHTNHSEVQLMLTDEWKEKVVSAVVGACNIFEVKN
jgi:N-acetylmuramoyl-L-alanine amidase|tara:strand:- start:152 stop:760 length:609 start_codon:yes stop_codon:yes gene_type:complete